MWKLILLPIGLIQLVSSQSYSDASCCDPYCYRQDQSPHLLFGTKTAYQFAYGRVSNQHIVPRCEPIQFWSLNRHGTRLPSKGDIEQLKELVNLKDEVLKNYEQRGSYPERGRMCEDDLDLFRRWRWNYTLTPENANQLTDQGADDIRYLARRYQTRFKKLLSPPYSSSDFLFRYTDTPRTYDSYKSYISGLFGDQSYQVHADTLNDDSLLKGYKTCSAWRHEVKENPEAMAEYIKFLEGPLYEDLIRQVSRRLGFRFNLNSSQIQDMYDMCRYEKAWNVQRPSAWCAAFSTSQLKIMEYAEDLKYYYESGYGNELNKELGCPPLKDMYERFEKTVSGDTDQPKAVAFFAHSSTLQLFLVAMGIAKDSSPLTADGYDRSSGRQWRTSYIDPFSANIAAILYKCQDFPEHRVMFFLNEKPVEYGGCSVGLCNWETVRNKLQDAAKNCNLDFCSRSSASIQNAILGMLFSVVTALTVFLH